MSVVSYIADDARPSLLAVVGKDLGRSEKEPSGCLHTRRAPLAWVTYALVTFIVDHVVDENARYGRFVVAYGPLPPRTYRPSHVGLCSELAQGRTASLPRYLPLVALLHRRASVSCPIKTRSATDRPVSRPMPSAIRAVACRLVGCDQHPGLRREHDVVRFATRQP